MLETVDGVGEVSLTGARLRQIRLFVDAEKLSAYGITINQFERAIQNENVDIPGGRIVRGENESACARSAESMPSTSSARLSWPTSMARRSA